MRPTLSDLAREAGVSTATVDRVLNNRAGVSERTRLQVRQAARRIGYLPEETPVPTAPLAFSVFLPGGPNAYMQELRGHFLAQARAMQGVTLRFPDVADLGPETMQTALLAPGAGDGIAVVAQSHPRVHEALRHLIARGTPVVTLASDLPDTRRLAYIGIDNLRAGRLAGQIITRFLGRDPRGTVALFAGSLRYRGHQEREAGLRQILDEEAPGLHLLELRESGEDRHRAAREAAAVLAADPRLRAIYNAGAGTQGIARALVDAGRARDVVFVAHEATDPNKVLLLDGTLDAVIDQSARAEAREAIACLVAAARGRNYIATPPRLQLILRENLPAGPTPDAP